jgi:hypothetical protein
MQGVNITPVGPGADATQNYVTPAYDVRNRTDAGYTVTLTGTTTPSIAVALQGSNAVPPTGNLAGFTPPSGSWFQIYVGGNAISETLTADGIYTLASDESGLQCRWVRLTYTVGTPGGGTVQVDYNSRGYA